MEYAALALMFLYIVYNEWRTSKHTGAIGFLLHYAKASNGNFVSIFRILKGELDVNKLTVVKEGTDGSAEIVQGEADAETKTIH